MYKALHVYVHTCTWPGLHLSVAVLYWVLETNSSQERSALNVISQLSAWLIDQSELCTNWKISWMIANFSDDYMYSLQLSFCNLSRLLRVVYGPPEESDARQAQVTTLVNNLRNMGGEVESGPCGECQRLYSNLAGSFLIVHLLEMYHSSLYLYITTVCVVFLPAGHVHSIKLDYVNYFVFTNSILTVLFIRWIFQSICFHVWFLWTATFGRSCLGMYLLSKWTVCNIQKVRWSFCVAKRHIQETAVECTCSWYLTEWMYSTLYLEENLSYKTLWEAPTSCMALPQCIGKVENLTLIFLSFSVNFIFRILTQSIYHSIQKS